MESFTWALLPASGRSVNLGCRVQVFGSDNERRRYFQYIIMFTWGANYVYMAGNIRCSRGGGFCHWGK